MTRAKRGFGQVRRLNSGRYSVRYTDLDGARRSAGHSFASKADAEAWAVGKRRALDRAKADESIAPLKEIEFFDPTGFFVYLLWGEDPETPLYVGKSTNILGRLGFHMNTAKRDPTQRIQLVRCATAQDMDDTEARLIGHYRPPLNVMGIVK
jgi:hypothetical protein